MGTKQVRLPEDFVEMLRQTYDGKNDRERLENWKKDNVKPEIEKLVKKLDELESDNSSTKNWTREQISDIAEEVVYSVMKQRQ